MRVLVVGSGGREHALAWTISASPLVDALFCAPGNAGIAEEAECVAIRATDIAGLVAFCRRERIDFVVVGPEAPLVLGLVDALEAEGIPAFGPSAAAAALEGSKVYAKDFCLRAGIPTAAYRRFRDPAAAKAFIASHGAPIVVKADGLAAGKGVTVATDLDTAYSAVDAALVERRLGAAGLEIVVEDLLEGEEASFFALVDGKTALPLATAQDYKRLGEGDTGPNTGGMGACSPAPCLDPALEGSVMERIILPAVGAMEREGRPFKGVLYAGLMRSAALRLRRVTPTSRSSTPPPAATASGCWPMAVGCSASPHSAPISPPPAAGHTPRSTRSGGPRASAAATSGCRRLRRPPWFSLPSGRNSPRITE